MEEPSERSPEAERQRLGGLVARSQASQLAGPARAASLADLRAGDTYAGLVRVLRNGPLKEFEHQGRPGKVARALVSDGTKALNLVAWGAQADLVSSLDRGATLRIENGYAKARDEALELHANDRAKLARAEPTNAPGETAFALAYPRRTLGELREGEEALVKARLVELHSLKSIAKCGACGERQAWPAEKCAKCGAEVRRIDLFAARLDDRTAGYRLAAFGSEARRLAGAQGEEPLDPLEDRARERLAGHEVVLVVRPRASTFGGGFELSCVAVVQAP